MDEIIRKILNNIEKDSEDTFDIERYEGFQVKRENFHDIITKPSTKKIVFIDGGNLEIIKSPSISLFFNRIYYTVYFDNKRIRNKVVEFYNLISAFKKNNRIFYKTEYYFIKNRLRLEEYEFDSFDKTLISGNNRASISVVGDIIRRFAELSIIKDINEDALFVLDGTLEAKYTYEDMLLQELYKDNICALSKTSSLLTKSGHTLTAYLARKTDKGIWYYFTGKATNQHHTAEIFFVKFHPKSDYVFRFEISKTSDINQCFSLLCENSKDPIFLGYPYGLVEADRFARVSFKEAESLQLQLRFKKGFERITPYINSLNAHKVLDKFIN